MENGKRIQYTVQQICDILGVSLPEEYKSIAKDTLSVMTRNPSFAKKGTCFFLLAKTREDCEEKLARAIKGQSKIVLCNEKWSDIPEFSEIPHIFVPDINEVIVKLTAKMREDLGCKVVGVTGSLGKTTTKEMIYSVLSQQFDTAKSPGNQNTAFLILGNLQKVVKGTEVYIQEFGAGIRHAPMKRNAQVCRPDVAVITNISDPHLDVFGTRENILKEKLNLILATPKGNPAFLNYDDALLKEVRLDDHPIISFAVNNKEADYYSENLQVYEDYMTFEIVHKGRRTPITLHSRGTHNVANALAATAIGEWFGVSVDKIAQGISSFRSEGIRQSLVNVGGYQLYVDCYNTAPISLLGAVDVLSRCPVPEGGKHIAVLGDIVRLGDQSEILHIETGTKLGASGKLDLVLCFGNEYAKIMADSIRAAGTAALYTPDRDVLNDWVRCLVTRKDVTLFKGPVARLISKTIDQVYGTCYHLTSEHTDRIDYNDFRVIFVFEKEDHTKRLSALLKYSGSDQVVVTPGYIDNTPVFSVAPGCFHMNKTLTQITVSEPVINIAEDAFRGCTKLLSISLPSSLLYIGDRAFRYCKALTEVDMPEGVIHLGEEAFSHCKNLTTVKLPASLGHIGDNAFLDSKKVKIICPAGSFAEQYAKEQGIPCQTL